MPDTAPQPPLGLEVTIRSIEVDDRTGHPNTTARVNGSLVKISLNGMERRLEPISITTPYAVDFAAKRHARLARFIETAYAQSIAEARHQITIELTKAHAA